MDVVFVSVHLIHIAMKVLFEDAMRQFYKSVLKDSIYDRMPIFCYHNQMVLKVITAMSVRAVTHAYPPMFALQPIRFMVK